MITALTRTFPVKNYDLAATLSSGQAFRWQAHPGGWNGIIGKRWVRLSSGKACITAETALPVTDWTWLTNYLQLDLDLTRVLSTFPGDSAMQTAVAGCAGLRLLRQDPWECLASFILSSTKQILQIQQIIALLCRRFGERVVVPPGQEPACSFPSAVRLAEVDELALRECKMGFRAPYLLATARRIAAREVDLAWVHKQPLEKARACLMSLPGVGEKIADCVLLFAYGCPAAFPVDVWVMRALRRLYFARRRVTPRRLREFSAAHFGPNAGYAQQYLFHYERTKMRNGVAIKLNA
jgi:N-glycosylase/DNA lyase